VIAALGNLEIAVVTGRELHTLWGKKIDEGIGRRRNRLMHRVEHLFRRDGKYRWREPSGGC